LSRTVTAAFPPHARLRSPREFEQVLAAGTRVSETPLTAAIRPNAMQHARLGLAISARAVPTAVARNRIKRQARETFRAARPQLPAVDVVLLARPGAGALAAAELRATLGRLWQRIARK
jgi:ribonuclease P protein component